MSGGAHGDFAAPLREQLVASLEAPATREWGRVRLREVYPDTAAARPTAVVLFTDVSRPGCVFGTRCSTDVVDVTPDDESSLRLAASICVTNIEEAVEADPGLPAGSPDETITWI